MEVAELGHRVMTRVRSASAARGRQQMFGITFALREHSFRHAPCHPDWAQGFFFSP